MRNNVLTVGGAFLIVATILYTAVIRDASLCYRVPACPQIRSVLLGY